MQSGRHVRECGHSPPAFRWLSRERGAWLLIALLSVGVAFTLVLSDAFYMTAHAALTQLANAVGQKDLMNNSSGALLDRKVRAAKEEADRELRVSRAEAASATAEVARLSVELHSSRAQLAEAKSTIESLNVQREALIGQLTVVAEKNRQLSALLEVRALQVARLTTTNEDLERFQRKARESGSRIGRTIANRAAKSAIRSLSTLAGKVIPLVGSGISVASAGWEIRDACSTLKEVGEMSADLDLQVPEEAERICGLRVPSKDELLHQLSGGWRDIYGRAATEVGVPRSPPTISAVEARRALCQIAGYGC